MHKLIKKLDTSARLAGALLKRAPSFEVCHGQLADTLGTVTLSDGTQAQLALPHHTHLAVGDVLIDEQGMMIRVTGAAQTVTTVSSQDGAALATLAFALGQSGWAVAFEGQSLLTEPVQELMHWLQEQGFTVSQATGSLDPPHLRAPVRSHGHDHEDHSKHRHHSHDHKQ